MKKSRLFAIAVSLACCALPDAPAQTGCDERRLIDRLAEHRFDAAIVFTTCTQSALPAALVCRLAGIPLRLAHSRENPYRLLTDWVPESDVLKNGMRHETARQLALVASVGLRTADERLRFDVGSAAALSLPGELRRAGLEPRQRYVVVHPGASTPLRRWPQHFVQSPHLSAFMSFASFCAKSRSV